ncbi:hypothetical protein, partial [Lactococcus cremoris]|uniref:hypothetical protein n=1 Tax=Lactococcus lactis subsp. cremoris TaxID=1359 RepID=UPI00062A274B
KKNALNFESSMVIITLVVMGKLLEHNAKEKTTQAITGLMSSRASVVHIKGVNIQALVINLLFVKSVLNLA